MKKPFEMTIVSSPVKAKARAFFWGPAAPTGPDPIDPALYFGSCGEAYNMEGRRRSGWATLPVLQSLWGRKLDKVVMSYVHSLRPSVVRITEGTVTLDCRIWRVTISIKKIKRTAFVTHISQEVEVLLPEGVSHGDALAEALAGGIDSPRVKWYSDATGYHMNAAGYFKETANGMRKWKFTKSTKNLKLWLKQKS